MKLTDDKIRWIIRRKADGSMTTAQIAELQGVDQSRIRQLWLEFRNTGKVPAIKEPGRPKRA
ncbi:MAG: IS481 family transposase, partial [Thaumarchaeota archaeon]|nr:IS481 family transposase [Nitrososphaerota archaeon]